MTNKKRTRVGSEAQYGPRPVGEVLHIHLENSREPLATAFRHRMAGLHQHTELCVDLKLLTREPGRMGLGTCVGGVLSHDGDDHFTFVENATAAARRPAATRNPFVYRGVRVNIHRGKDGALYPTFNIPPAFSGDFSFKDFCYEAADELCIVGGLIGNKKM